MADQIYVQYAIASSTHATANTVSYHGYGNNQRGNVGQYRLADLVIETLTTPTLPSTTQATTTTAATTIMKKTTTENMTENMTKNMTTIMTDIMTTTENMTTAENDQAPHVPVGNNVALLSVNKFIILFILIVV